jgi:hypothetical protein
MLGEELIYLGQDASTFFFLQVLRQSHHALFVKATAASLARFVFKEFTFNELPFIISMGIKELADAVELLRGDAKNSGCLLKGEGIT